MKKNIPNKRWWYTAGVILLVFLIVIDIIKFRIKNKESIVIQKTTDQKVTEEIIPEESVNLKEGEDDDYKYHEGLEITTQEDLKPEYEEFYEEFNTEG